MTTQSVFDFSATRIDGQAYPLKPLQGNLLLIVNTASQCGFTPQYAGLEKLHQTYAARGLVVLGFPCNQFGAQEPGDATQIQTFCERNFGVSFPLLAKVAVNGQDAHPLFAWLREAAPGLLGIEAIKWNFTKFLVSRDGLHVKRYAPQTKPESLVADIEAWL